jgi:hypothetical protein
VYRRAAAGMSSSADDQLVTTKTGAATPCLYRLNWLPASNLLDDVTHDLHIMQQRHQGGCCQKWNCRRGRQPNARLVVVHHMMLVMC